MDTRTIELNFKRLRSHQSVKPFKFLFPHNNVQKESNQLSKENLKNILTPYFTDKIGGMGLGLSTTINFLKANHATVDVQSEEGKGTRFILCFERIQQSGE